MIAPKMPDNFYPDEPFEERVARWLVLEKEAEEMQRLDLMMCNEPQSPRPFWMRDCTVESALRMRGYL